MGAIKLLSCVNAAKNDLKSKQVRQSIFLMKDYKAQTGPFQRTLREKKTPMTTRSLQYNTARQRATHLKLLAASE